MIRNMLPNRHRREQRRIRWFGLNRDERLPINGDLREYLLDE